MSATEKQITANRQNAQKSTGPKTEIGKRKSAQNALKHGLFAASPVISDSRFNEDQEEYDLLKKSLTEELKPFSTSQTHLVQKIADSIWRYRRVVNFEKSSYQKSSNPDEQRAFWAMLDEIKFQHYVKTGEASPADIQAYNELLAKRKNTPPDENVPIPSEKDSLIFGRYESRLDRQLHRSFRMLRILQRLESPSPRTRRKKRKK